VYSPPPFQIDRAASLAFAEARGYGLVCVSDGGRPVASSLPFHIAYACDGTPLLSFHVARGNALARLADGRGQCLVAVSGADAYVSPHWYASPDQVPTWLYQNVHLTGPARPMTAAELGVHLDLLSAAFERSLAPKPPWTRAEVPAGRHAQLSRAIAGFVVSVETIEGTFKLNQHKSDADHAAVAMALMARGDHAAQTIGREMLALRPQLDYTLSGSDSSPAESETTLGNAS
jgi:transcriptional regulator